MTEKKTKWYNSTWIVTIFGGIITTTVGTLVYDWAKQKPILSTLAQLSKTFWTYVVTFITFKLPLWTVVVVAFLAWVVRKISSKKKKTESKPAFWNYREDKFKNWIWRWDYGINIMERQYEIRNLQPYCPYDDTQLVNKSTYLQAAFECPRCNTTFSERSVYQSIPPEDATSIKALIWDNIRKGNY